MSAQSVALRHDAFPNRVPNIFAFFDRLIVKPLKRWRHRQVAIDDLRRLDDRILADIGILRSEIPRVVDRMLAHEFKSYAQSLPPN